MNAVHIGALAMAERDILLWIQEHLRCAVLTPPMRLFSLLGDKGIFWIVLTLLLLCYRRTRRVGCYCAASMVLSFLAVNCLIKPLVARVRPYDLFPEIRLLVEAEHDYSFPSGHSANSFAVAWILFRMAPKKFGIPALTLATLISLSRLYVGVHYPTDVLAGVVIAIALAELVLHLLPKLEKKRRRKHRHGKASAGSPQSAAAKRAPQKSTANAPRKAASGAPGRAAKEAPRKATAKSPKSTASEAPRKAARSA